MINGCQGRGGGCFSDWMTPVIMEDAESSVRGCECNYVARMYYSEHIIVLAAVATSVESITND